MPRASHRPGPADSALPNIEVLLSRYRNEQPTAFYGKPGLALDGKIPFGAAGWTLATHPLCWNWLIGQSPDVETLTYSIAHWLIGKNDFDGCSGYKDWLVGLHLQGSPCASAISAIEKWMAGEKDKRTAAVARASQLNRGLDQDTCRLFEWVKQKFPEWAANFKTRLPHGAAKQAVYELSLDMTEDAARRRLKRAKHFPK